MSMATDTLFKEGDRVRFLTNDLGIPAGTTATVVETWDSMLIGFQPFFVALDDGTDNYVPAMSTEVEHLEGGE